MTVEPWDLEVGGLGAFGFLVSITGEVCPHRCAWPVSGTVWGGAGDPAMEQQRGLGVSDTSGGLEGALGGGGWDRVMGN